MKNKILLVMAIGLFTINLAIAQNQWVSLSSSPNVTLNSVYFVSADTGYVCAYGRVYKTNNGGINWSQVSNNGPSSSLCFLNAYKGFGTYENNLLVTQNSGNTWSSRYTNPDFIEIKNICFPDKKHGFATAWSNEGIAYVLKTNNGGTNWDTIGIHDSFYPIFQSSFFKDSLNGYIGSDVGRIYKTTNGGISWITIPVDIANSVVINSIYFPTTDTGYAGTEEHGVYRSIDSGNTWNHLSFNFLSAVHSVWFNDANHGFVCGGDEINYMVLYKTDNGGNSWSQCSSLAHSLNAMFFVGSMPGYAVGDNIVMKYTNTAGVDDNMFSETNINLYPNPATNSLTIETPQNAAIEIVNMQGQLVKTIPANDNKTSIDVSTLPGGLYFIKLTTEEGSVVRKFVKE